MVIACNWNYLVANFLAMALRFHVWFHLEFHQVQFLAWHTPEHFGRVALNSIECCPEALEERGASQAKKFTAKYGNWFDWLLFMCNAVQC